MPDSGRAPEASSQATRRTDTKASAAERERLRARIAEVMPSAGQPDKEEHPPPNIPDHELVRKIGRGAYGHVWLARSATGAFRAVKVVYRSSFDSDRPFEREFAGIQRFEPISRSHESQVDVLHVGRNENEGYFYYVMELADDAGSKPPEQGQTISLSSAPAVSPAHYHPRTLRSELERQERLPFDTCLEIALALTTSLEHLHKHGLIHRDIKPSNIIFVNGRPKLADIGLVSEADATCSFVGTEGYLPPEGPGAAQADLYSLGKVLYEISTGKDRRDFPALPEPHSSLDEERRFLELNAIILKACQRNPLERYESAEQIHADLLLLQAGKSVRRTHQLERRLAMASRAGAVFLVVSVVATGAWAWASYQRQLATKNLARAEKSESAMREQLRESLLHQARGLRLSGRPGQRSEALAALGRAAAIRPGADLRSEAVRCLALAEMRAVRSWTNDRTRPSIFAINLHQDGFVESDRAGNLVIRSIADNTEVGQLPGPGWSSWNTLFSPDGRYLSAKYHGWGQDILNQVKIWDVSQKQTQVHIPGGIRAVAFDFSPDSRFAASGTQDNDLLIHELTSGKELLRYPLGFAPYAMSYSPDGTRLAISSLEGAVQIRSTTDGGLLKTFEHPAGARGLAWHPDARRLAVACEDWLIHLWNVETERRVGVFVGHKAQAISVKFSHHGKWLATFGWDKTVALWDVERTQLLVASRSPEGTRFLEFSPDDTRLARSGDEFEANITEITWPITVYQSTGFRVPNLSMADVSSDGKLAAVTTGRGVMVRSIDAPERGTNWNLGRMRAVRFLPDDRLMVGGGAGLFLTQVQRPSGNNDAWSFSPPVALWTNRFFEGPDDFALTRDQRTFKRTFIARADTNAAVVLDMACERNPVLLKPHAGLTYTALSPDGRWAATASSREPEVKIWDATSGALLKTLAGAGPARIDFVPNEGSLVISSRNGCSILRPGTWEVLHRISHAPPLSMGRLPRAVVSADGELMAVGWGIDLVRLIHLPTGEPLLDLEALTQIPLSFSPGNDKLYVFGQNAFIYTWDLNLIRRHLATIELNWKTVSSTSFEGHLRAGD
jgi:WD40 repeat protein